MYSENNRRSTVRRADDEFLRRMMGGELTGDAIPFVKINTASPRMSEIPQRNEPVRISCRGTVNTPNNGAHDSGHEGHHSDCPTSLDAPSLAMVYSPKQCWRNLLDPVSGLKQGTIFAELVLPLEVESHQRGTEVKNRRPF
ncbi:MAG: spore coat associated protein CotJA [Clostridia bacterium]|nr:spore coat associated protein CotJA [Clostridia bacterium]